MQPNKDLTPQEHQNLNEQLRITSREAKLRENMTVMPGAPPGIEEFFMKNIMEFEDKISSQPTTTIAELLSKYDLPKLDGLTEKTAKKAVTLFLKALAKENMTIDRPKMVKAKEFYRWLSEEFTKEEIRSPLGDGWSKGFIYTEMVPEGPDAMDFMVRTCLEDLFRLESDLNPWTFEDDLITKEEGDGPTQIIPSLYRYITAWRAAAVSVADYRYKPLTGIRIGENLADFTFDISYTIIRENGTHDAFSGPGTAKLVYDGSYWSIRNISFPGFKMPELPQ